MNVAVLNTRQPADATAPRLRALRIAGGTVLRDGVSWPADVGCRDGMIDDEVRHDDASVTLDASGLHVLPGIIDIHGDGFERLIHPRPGVGCRPVGGPAGGGPPVRCQRHHDGLSCRDVVMGGRHTRRRGGAHHPRDAGTTAAYAGDGHAFSSAPRDLQSGRRAIILDWITQGRIDALAFNDHMAATIKERHRPEKVLGMITRSGLDEAASSNWSDGPSHALTRFPRLSQGLQRPHRKRG